MTSFLECQEVEKNYGDIRALRGVSFKINLGEAVCITGRSGSGKTTLLNCLGMLERVSHGNILLNGQTFETFLDKEKLRVRRTVFGFVFQQFHLFPYLSALDNVALPLVYRGVPWNAARSEAIELLTRFGMAPRSALLARKLSGGEAQRVAVARALIYKPVALLADEPTGELDSNTAKEVVDLMLQHKSNATTVVVVSHDPVLIERVDRVLSLQDGKIT